MSTPAPRPPVARAVPDGDGYWDAARQPLQILVFLLPMLVFYEAGLALWLTSGEAVLTNKAHDWLLRFFESFNLAVAGLMLPAIAVVVVLLTWQVLSGRPWRVSWPVFGFMAVESAALTVPIFALGLVVQMLTATPAAATAGADVASLGLLERVIVSLGAGIYEELIFRMLIILLIHSILVDIGKASNALGIAVAVIISSGLFAAYHDLTDASGRFSLPRLAFYFVAGLYFAGLYVARGFGIVVATHALYDIVTAVFLIEASEA